MTRRAVTHFTCDACGGEVALDRGERMPAGWLRFDITVSQRPQRHRADYCSAACARSDVNKLLKLIARAEQENIFAVAQ